MGNIAWATFLFRHVSVVSFYIVAPRVEPLFIRALDRCAMVNMELNKTLKGGDLHETVDDSRCCSLQRRM